jgi:lysophospholipase L1-like esterase
LSLGLKSGRNVINESVTGDASQELLMSQIHNLNKASRSRFGTQYPDYVTLLIGANDACAETPEEMEDLGTFYARFYMVTEELLWNSPKTHVLVSHLPNIEKIRAIAKDASVFGFDTLGITTCQDLWETINLCPTFTTLSDPIERQKVSTRISQYNQVMTDVTKQLRGRYGDRLRLSKRAYEVEFTPDHLSLDCFHPNARGQNRLAEETWKDSWWSDLSSTK